MPGTYLPAAARLDMAVKLDEDMLRRLNLGPGGKKADRRKTTTWLVPLCLDTLADESALGRISKLLETGQLDSEHVIWGFREPEVRDKIRRAQTFIEKISSRWERVSPCAMWPPDSDVEPLLRQPGDRFPAHGSGNDSEPERNDSLRQQLSNLVSYADEHQVRVNRTESRTYRRPGDPVAIRNHPHPGRFRPRRSLSLSENLRRARECARPLAGWLIKQPLQTLPDPAANSKGLDRLRQMAGLMRLA